MKRSISILLLVVLLLTTLFSSCAFAENKYTVSLTIDFEENWFLSKYDVALYANDTFIASLEHGKDYSGSFDVPAGSNTIWFYNRDKQSVKGSIKFDASSSVSITCGIHCKSNKIEVTDVEIIKVESTSSPAVTVEKTDFVSDVTASEPTTRSISAPDVSIENGIWLDFNTCSDEELEEAIIKIKAEQRARLTTKVSLDYTSLSLAKGKTQKVTAEVVDVPEDLKAGKIEWSSSDNKIATCQQGNIRGVANGTAVITAKSVLSDGTEIYEECLVTVFTPVSGLTSKTKNYNIGVGESVQTEITVAPKDATTTALKYESSDRTVATVSESGLITGTGVGKATITATTTDGSEKSIQFNVSATKKDDIGKVLISKDGISMSVTGYKESKGNTFTSPEPGNIFLLVDVQIENNSSDSITVSTILSFDGYCDGFSTDSSFSASMAASNTADGTVAAGKKMKGQVGFEVPKDWKEFEIVFSPEVWSSEKLSFVIYKK